MAVAHALLPAPERDFRGPGCTDACVVVRAIVPGRVGRSELLLHSAADHEAFGRWQIEVHQAPGGVIQTGPLEVDIPRCEIRVDGRAIHATPTETRLLLALARRAGQLADGRYLIESTWGTDHLIGGWQTSAHLLRVNIARLRMRLGLVGSLITTVTAAGFRLEVIPADAPVPVHLRPLRTRLDGRWSLAQERCVCCHSAERPHQAGGRCRRCYVRGAERHEPCRKTTP